MKKEQNKVTYITLLAAALGIALMLSFLESILPLGFLIPGFKLGLSNSIVLLCLKAWGLRQALLINLTRILITALLFGNILSLALSLCGGLCSTLLMYFLLKFKGLSNIGVSSAAGAIHNLAQLGTALLLLDTFGISHLAPFLCILGGATGAICGLAAQIAEKNLKFADFALFFKK